MANNHKNTIRIFAFIEIGIGMLSLINAAINIMQGKYNNSLQIAIFVITTGLVSTILGLGLLIHDRSCYNLLLYFSSMIIFSKVLILCNIITLNGALEGVIPSGFRNMVSILYHGAVIYYFTRKPIKEYFEK